MSVEKPWVVVLAEFWAPTAEQQAQANRGRKGRELKVVMSRERKIVEARQKAGRARKRRQG